MGHGHLNLHKAVQYTTLYIISYRIQSITNVSPVGITIFFFQNISMSWIESIIKLDFTNLTLLKLLILFLLNRGLFGTTLYLPVTPERSFVYFRYSCLLHQWIWLPQYSRNIIENGAQRHSLTWGNTCSHFWVISVSSCVQSLFWIYSYMCNQCLSPLTLWVRIPFMTKCTHTTLCDKVC